MCGPLCILYFVFCLFLSVLNINIFERKKIIKMANKIVRIGNAEMKRTHFGCRGLRSYSHTISPNSWGNNSMAVGRWKFFISTQKPKWKIICKKESETTWKKTKEEYKNINVYIHKKLFLFINVTDQATNVIFTPV